MTPTPSPAPAELSVEQRHYAQGLRILAGYLRADEHLKPGTRQNWADFLDDVSRHIERDHLAPASQGGDVRAVERDLRIAIWNALREERVADHHCYRLIEKIVPLALASRPSPSGDEIIERCAKIADAEAADRRGQKNGIGSFCDSILENQATSAERIATEIRKSKGAGL